MEKKKIALLSNVTADLLRAKLSREYDVYIPEGYDTWVREVIDPSSGLYAYGCDAVIVLIDATESREWKDHTQADDRMMLWKQAVTALSKNMPQIPVFVSTIDIRESRIRAVNERIFGYELENEWYEFIQLLSENSKNIYAFDVKNRIADMGRDNFYSDKMWYLSSMPYSRDGLNALVKEIKYLLGSIFSPRKKIIAVDLDNTLWGGVVGEDGQEGIELSNHKEGQRYYDFQRMLLEMKQRGIVLAVNSKNNESDALTVIDSHPYMLLRSDDFVSLKINWKDKASNIKEMAKDLNLTEGSFIFIDDNPVEREIVSGECPDVYVADFPEDTTKLADFAQDIYLQYCRPLRILDEDLKKTEMYKLESKRKQDMDLCLDLDEYISKLEMEVDIHKMLPQELERTAQLCNKTNQFNLTTKRYTAADISDIANDENALIITVHSKDKYGDNGLISVLITRRDGESVTIDTFLMSCRVMGRKLENVIMSEVIDHYKSDAKYMIGEYFKTEKNAPVKELYDRLGFELVSDNDGHRIYKLDLHKAQPEKTESYKKIQVDI